MNQRQKQAKLQRFLKSISPNQDLEALSVPKGALENVGGSDASNALESLTRGDEMSASDMHTLEAIILPKERPVIDIKNDRYLTPEEPFEHLDRVQYRQRIEPAIKAIGRVELPNHPRAPYGGTAFLVGDGVMMTNRHVAEIFALGVGREGLRFRGELSAAIDLKREVGSDEAEEEPVLFDVRDILMIHPYWDMALLRVSGMQGICPLQLDTVRPEELVGEEVAVIGYPALDPRNEVALQNQIFRGEFNVKRMQPGKIGKRSEINSYDNMVNTVTHDSSTLGGNSGSAVIHLATGNVVALHFAGRYLEANYAVPSYDLSRDRHVVDAQVRFTGSVQPGPTPWDQHWRDADGDTESHLTSSGSPAVSSPAGPATIQAIPQGTSVTWSIPMTVTVQIGGQNPAPIQPTPSVAASQPSDGGGSFAVTERLVEPPHDTDYANRPGYDQDFLGVRLPLPTIMDVDVVSRMEDGQFVLPYHHFSLVLHKHRRLAIYTASNVDGRERKREPESGKKYTRKSLGNLGKNDREKWFNDPRVPDAHQLPNSFYNNDRGAFDKGHLVRRDDVTWGDSFEEVQFANGDTFHVTNCSPQVGDFNQSRLHGIWGKLENVILKQAEGNREKYSVFSGPIFRDDDRVFEGKIGRNRVNVKIPSTFWKIITVNNAGTLNSYAFLLDQDLSDVDFDDTRELAFGDQWRRHTISIGELQDELGIVQFPRVLHQADMKDRF